MPMQHYVDESNMEAVYGRTSRYHNERMYPLWGREEVIDLRKSHGEPSSPGQVVWDDIGDGDLFDSLSWSPSEVDREIETWDQRLRDSGSPSSGRRTVTWRHEYLPQQDLHDDVYMPRRPTVRDSHRKKVHDRHSIYKYSGKESEGSSRQLLLPQRSASVGRQTPRPKPCDNRSRAGSLSDSGVLKDPCRSYDHCTEESRSPEVVLSPCNSPSPAAGAWYSLSSRLWLAIILVLVVGMAVIVSLPYALNTDDTGFQLRLQLAATILRQVPLIDGHNDLPWNIRKFLHNRLKHFKFDDDLRNVAPWGDSDWSHTDLARLKASFISAQFWVAYVPCAAQFKDAVQLSFEQVDVIRRLTDRYRPDLTFCTSSQDIEAAHKAGQLCSLIGVEGGHVLGSSLPILRALYAVGVRYLTLTSTCSTPWAECAAAGQRADGLTSFGRSVVREMNRLGMVIDLSHVSEATMVAALNATRAPVLFSHSAAYALCNASRNVPDHILRLLAANDGVIMINFDSRLLTCRGAASVHDAIAHIEHVKSVAGADHVGLGAGYDGMAISPSGLPDVASYPVLFAELLAAGWAPDQLQRLAGLNVLRVLRRVEHVRDGLRRAGLGPSEEVIAPRLIATHAECTTKHLF